MEGDAGASQLNPIDAEDSLSSEAKTEVSEETAALADPADQISSEPARPAVAEASDAAADNEAADNAAADGAVADTVEAKADGVDRGRSRLGRAWLVGIAAVLIFLAAAVGAGGYYALHSHREIQAVTTNDEAALKVAKDCVAATQAPDTSSMAASEQKIIDCGTDQYRTQALLYSSMLVQAYQAANVHLKVSDLRAAVERNNPDGTVDILVALRVNVSNDQQQNQETGYRLRVKMTPSDGTYKISKLDQVTK